MKQRAQIIASFFLVIYASFLLHNLFAHSHGHEQDAHDHCHFVIENHQISQLGFSVSDEPQHVDGNCSLCENDGKMHQHIVFFRAVQHDQNALAPQQENIYFFAFHETEEIFISEGDPFISQTPLTASLRAPPAIS